MSYLSNKIGLSNLEKAVISLWFRVPKSSLDACSAAAAEAEKLAESGDYSGVNALLNGILPLVTFGVKGERRQAVSAGDTQIGSYIRHIMVLTDDNLNWREEPPGWWVDPETTGSPFTIPITSPAVPTLGGAIATNPSCIGIDCRTYPPTLYVRFETGRLPDAMSGYSVVSAATGTTEWTYTWPWLSYPPALSLIPDYTPPPNHDPIFEQSSFDVPGGGVIEATAATDISWVSQNITVVYCGTSNIVVTPDQWHHVLVSVDISEGCSVTNGVVAKAAKMWVAFDDVNYTGTTMSGSNPAGGGPNDILATGALSFVGMAHPPGELGEPYSYKASAAISGGEVGIPSFSSLSKSIHKVQMAELQIFTGVSLDTSIVGGRRAFINKKGQPVDEAYGVAKFRGIYGPKSPIVTPAAPVKLLGKMPDISLTRACGVWIGGSNLGTMREGFYNSGKIHPVYPDPVLGK